MKRISQNFNREWLFAYGDIRDAQKEDFNTSGWTPIALPHSFSIPYDLNDDKFYIGYGWYRKEFRIESNWKNKFISLDFDGVFQETDIFINGTHIPQCAVYGYENKTDKDAVTHKGGYSGFSVNITEYLKYGEKNTIAVKVDNIWQPYLTPRGGDHQFSGGIYRDVTLTVTEKAHIDWHGTFVWTPAICNPNYQVSENRPANEYKTDFERMGTGITNTLDDPNVDGEYVSERELDGNIKNRTSDVEVQTEITNTDDKEILLYVCHRVIDKSGNTVSEFQSEAEVFMPNEKKTLTARSKKIKNIMLWDFDNPNLYSVITELYASTGEKLDNYETTFGFRSVQFKLGGFYLNCKKILLDGANVHQDHGGWADAVTDQGFVRDVAYVKKCGFNFIRGSHYPHDTAFSDACDKYGIGLWSEGGLWSIGGFNDNDTVDMMPSDWTRGAYPVNATQEQIEQFEESCYRVVGTMIRTHRNHPSILMWSMGNEAFFSDDSVLDKVKRLISNLRDYAHSIDYTRKAGLGGTQRKDLNVLAVCDIAGGNGDGGTAQYTNFYLPHLVAEYSSSINDRPGHEYFEYGSIAKDKSNEGEKICTQYILPSKTVTFADGSTALSESAGLAVWCMYHHGSVGGRPLRIMGIMDYFRLPLNRYYMFRKDRTGNNAPPKSVNASASAIRLEGSTDTMLDEENNNHNYVITNDGKTDIQLIATLVDENGKWVSDTPTELVMEVVSGNGVFPTGKKYIFKRNKNLWDGRGSVEFRSYYSGDTVIRAYVPNTSIISNTITVRTENVLGIDEGKEPENFMLSKPINQGLKITEPESYGKIDAAYFRQSAADSSSKEHIPVNAIDGKNDTYWQAGVAGSNQSWWVMLENSYFIQKVKVKADKYPYTVYYDKNAEWVKLSDCNGDEEEIDFGGIYTGGIKVTFREIPNDKYAVLYELNAYGTAFTGYEQNSKCLWDIEPLKQNINETIYEIGGRYSRFTADMHNDINFALYGAVKDIDGELSETLIINHNTNETNHIDISLNGIDRIKIVSDKASIFSHTPMLWGIIRDISSTDNFEVYAAKYVNKDSFAALIRIINNGDVLDNYRIVMAFEDNFKNRLDFVEQNYIVYDKKCTYDICIEKIPAGTKIVRIKVYDIDDKIIGSGIL